MWSLQAGTRPDHRTRSRPRFEQRGWGTNVPHTGTNVPDPLSSACSFPRGANAPSMSRSHGRRESSRSQRRAVGTPPVASACSSARCSTSRARSGLAHEGEEAAAGEVDGVDHADVADDGELARVGVEHREQARGVVDQAGLDRGLGEQDDVAERDPDPRAERVEPFGEAPVGGGEVAARGGDRGVPGDGVEGAGGVGVGQALGFAAQARASRGRPSPRSRARSGGGRGCRSRSGGGRRRSRRARWRACPPSSAAGRG